MMYPFMVLDDKTEIVHSEMKPDGTVKVYMERPTDEPGFDHATCYLPGHVWEDIYGYTQEDMERLKRIVRENAHLIMEFSQKGGVLHSEGS